MIKTVYAAFFFINLDFHLHSTPQSSECLEKGEKKRQTQLSDSGQGQPGNGNGISEKEN